MTPNVEFTNLIEIHWFNHLEWFYALSFSPDFLSFSLKTVSAECGFIRQCVNAFSSFMLYIFLNVFCLMRRAPEVSGQHGAVFPVDTQIRFGSERSWKSLSHFVIHSYNSSIISIIAFIQTKVEFLLCGLVRICIFSLKLFDEVCLRTVSR